MCYTNGMELCKGFENKIICVAVSGGADSVALLHFCKGCEKEGGYSLVAAHCEHGIRGEESIADMRFVEGLCRAWSIPLYCFQEDCVARAKREKVSLETAARNFRYACFSALLDEGKADYIATAHHRGDEAETVLFRLCRGASLSGAAAMREQSGVFLRPFLQRSKQDVFDYIQANGLSYREDRTNLETQATRNKLRLEILPALEAAIPESGKNLARFAALAAEDDALLYELSNGLLRECEGGIEVAFCEKKPLFTRACLTALKRLGVERDYTSTHLNALYALQSLERGAQLSLPKGIRAKKREGGVFLFVENEEQLAPLAQEESCERDEFEGGRYAAKLSLAPPTDALEGWKILTLDREKLPKTAVFRFRKEGDTIRTFGGVTKSLKKFFNEKKIPVKAREGLPLLAERESGVVYAVCGVEICEALKVDEGATPTYLYLRK